MWGPGPVRRPCRRRAGRLPPARRTARRPGQRPAGGPSGPGGLPLLTVPALARAQRGLVAVFAPPGPPPGPARSLSFQFGRYLRPRRGHYEVGCVQQLAHLALGQVRLGLDRRAGQRTDHERAVYDVLFVAGAVGGAAPGLLGGQVEDAKARHLAGRVGAALEVSAVLPHRHSPSLARVPFGRRARPEGRAPEVTMPAAMTTRSFFRSLRRRNFRLFLAGQLVSNLGTWMQNVALAWLVLEVSHSPLDVGLVSALQFLPSLLFGAYGGVVADRFAKRWLLVLTQSGMGAAAAVLSVLDFSGAARLWAIYLVTFLSGMFQALDTPVRQAFVPEMVGLADLPNAVGLNSATFNVTRVGGPALGALVVNLGGVGDCFALNALSYLAVIRALLAMRKGALLPARPVRSARGGARGQPGGSRGLLRPQRLVLPGGERRPAGHEEGGTAAGPPGALGPWAGAGGARVHPGDAAPAPSAVGAGGHRHLGVQLQHRAARAGQAGLPGQCQHLCLDAGGHRRRFGGRGPGRRHPAPAGLGHRCRGGPGHGPFHAGGRGCRQPGPGGGAAGRGGFFVLALFVDDQLHLPAGQRARHAGPGHGRLRRDLHGLDPARGQPGRPGRPGGRCPLGVRPGRWGSGGGRRVPGRGSAQALRHRPSPPVAARGAAGGPGPSRPCSPGWYCPSPSWPSPSWPSPSWPSPSWPSPSCPSPSWPSSSWPSPSWPSPSPGGLSSPGCAHRPGSPGPGHLAQAPPRLGGS